jgi:protoporphyrinogen oxidase
MTTYILGAGPAGLAVVDGLVDCTAGDFVLIEKSNDLGGLAKTIDWGLNGSHDLGPHKIFSLDYDLVNRVEALLPSTEWLTRKKISSIFIKGHYLPYPPSPFSLAGIFGLSTFIRMVFGYGISRILSLARNNKPLSFQDDLVSRLGSPLFEVLFKPIAEKLWGSPSQLDVKLSKGRVQTPSLLEIFGRLLGIKKNSDFEALTFRYPKGGLGRIWDAIKTKSQHRGSFLLNHSVTRIDLSQGKVKQIILTSEGKDQAITLSPEDRVVSTLPLELTLKFLSPPPETDLLKDSEKLLKLNDLLLVFFYLDTPSLLDESWIFIPDPDIAFHRLSEQESFDPSMTPKGSIICCEIMSSETRPFSLKTDEQLYEVAEAGLYKMGYDNFNILDKRVIRLPKSYPVFQAGYDEGLIKIIDYLDQIENFRSIGRQGAFNYIGTLDAMDIGYGYAKWVSRGCVDSWKEERLRTSHYPVLD